ncbi:MAG TPA: hypothetical protein VJA26_02990 [Gammaproteobacteria bacterium]|nr:hypothetical protein [Gammaproteobacteria bacterium]
MQLTRPLLLAVILLCGCTTMRPVELGAIAAVLAELKTGDRVSVRTSERLRENLEVLSVTTDGFQAADDGEVLTVARSDVLELQIPRAAPGKTVATVYAGIFGLAALFSGGID